MRKLIICLAIATVAVSCKKIQAGGNKNAIKMEEGQERYSDDKQVGLEGQSHEEGAKHGEVAGHGEVAKTDSATAKKADSAKAEH
ncbi:MAG: hypothetical protein KBS61_01330 [Chryseobacterium sp.]|nr:hypothetical protein [Candidatus Chryseobacterium enterohippi]